MNAAPEKQQKILALLGSSDLPLTAEQIAKTAFGFASAQNTRDVAGMLNELKTSGRAFEFAAERKGYAVRFCHISPADWLGKRIVSKVEKAGGRLTLGQVRSKLRTWETKYFDEALGRLIGKRRLFYLTLKYKYLLSSPPLPFDHLLARQVSALREILDRVNRRRNDKLTLDELKSFLNGVDRTEASAGQASGRPSEDLLSEWYRKDLPKRGGLSFIPLPWTWSRYESWCLSMNAKPDPERFQEFMRDFHRAGKIELIPHSMTQEIPAREAEISLRGRHGEVLYYWRWR